MKSVIGERWFFYLTSVFGAMFVFVLNFSNVMAQDKRCTSVSAKTCELAKNLKRGINMGNMLDAPNEGDWGARLDPAYVEIVKGHFQTVRIPVRWSNNASLDSRAEIEPWFFKRVDRVVDDFLSQGFYVILDLHHYNQLYGGQLNYKEKEVSPDVVERRFYNMWKQIAKRYQDRSDRLIFEPLNEPQGSITALKWEKMFAKVLKIIRKTNPDRTVMMGPVSWNSVTALPSLRLPRTERNVIVTVHTYEPFEFTHQGMSWTPWKETGVTCCNFLQKRKITQSLDKAVEWSERKGYPIYLGEFGSHSAGDMASRAEYTQFVRQELEKRDINWAFWEFASTFGMYDSEKKQWRAPLKKALLGD